MQPLVTGSDDAQRIARYLTTLKRPRDLSSEEFLKFKKEALTFSVRDSKLFKVHGKGKPPTLVVGNYEDQVDVMHRVHSSFGHKGVESTYRKVADRFWWKDLFKDVRKFVQTCSRCQHRRSDQREEAMFPTWVSTVWTKVAIDITELPSDNGFKMLVVLRDDLTGWVEAKPLRNGTSQAVADFLWELELLSEDIDEAVLRKQRHREAGKVQFDRTYNVERKEIYINMSNTMKLSYRWLGPFRVTYADPIKGTYKLAELDGIPLCGTFAGKRLKKFLQRDALFVPVEEESENEG
ncbi:retrotransposon nucleocapsid protein [Rutstroemia sp. NJR-2017a WRK4]|nr:retrotransposon nucleocapsid protein [Rutstroemia sp. NJR-2017a WRK4]